MKFLIQVANYLANAFSMLCDKNIGSANKLPLAWQEEFGVGAPSSW